jgi:Recombinase
MGSGRAYGLEVGGVVQIPAEVAVIREVATRMLAGEPLQQLAAELNERGLTTSRGSKWKGQNLGRLLGGHRYGGLVEHHGRPSG